MTGGPSLDPPVYRPFALLAFAAVLLLGAPLGMWLLMRPAGAAAWLIWLHAAVQLFGFLATLIVGVAHHLLPRFTGRAVRPSSRPGSSPAWRPRSCSGWPAPWRRRLSPPPLSFP
jgi:hypothetical protein